MIKNALLQITASFFIFLFLFACSNEGGNLPKLASNKKTTPIDEVRENKAYAKLETDVDAWRKKLGIQIYNFDCSQECQTFVKKFADSQRLEIFLSEYEKCILKPDEQKFLSCIETSNQKANCSLTNRDCVSMNSEAWSIIHSEKKSKFYGRNIEIIYDELIVKAKIFCSAASSETKKNDIFFLENCKNAYYFRYATPYN